MTGDPVPPEVVGILGARGEAVSALALRLRAVVFEALPDAIEQPDASAGLVGYALGPRLADSVCVIAPQRAWVNLGLYRAVDLPDPAGLLVGTGKLHRHVKVRSVEDLGSPPLRALLEEAVTRGRVRRGG